MQIYAKWNCTQRFVAVDKQKKLKRREQSSHRSKSDTWKYLALFSWTPWRWLVLVTVPVPTMYFYFIYIYIYLYTHIWIHTYICTKPILCLYENCLGHVNILCFQIYTFSLESLSPAFLFLRPPPLPWLYSGIYYLLSPTWAFYIILS